MVMDGRRNNGKRLKEYYARQRLLCRMCEYALAVIFLKTNGLKLPKGQRGYCKECYERGIRHECSEQFEKTAIAAKSYHQQRIKDGGHRC